MRTLKQQFFLFKKTKQCFWIILIFIVFSLGEAPYRLVRIYIERGMLINAFDVFSGLEWSLSGQLYGYIVFIFVTYEFLSLACSHRVSETLSYMPVSRLSQEKAQLLILFFINLFLFAMHFLENVILAAITGNFTGEYIWYSMKLLVLYVIGVNTIAILSGYIISMIPYRVISYILLVFFAFFETLRYQQVMGKERFGTFTELTQFFWLKWAANDGYLFSIELHFWAKTLIMISALLFVVFAVLYVRFWMKRMIIFEGLVILVALGCFGVWRQEISGCYQGYEDNGEQIYEMRSDEDAEQFFVKKYDLYIQIDNYMHIRAEMILSDNSLNTYYFTLFSGFDVTKVTDLSGNVLTYTFDGNVMEIANEQGCLEGVVIEYEGVGTNQCFAGKQGMCLMGNVPYYPLAGVRPYHRLGQCALEQAESVFHVTVDYPGRVFCNLSRISEGEFTGSSNHVTLVGGFWQEETVNGINYIFPKYSTWSNPRRSAYLREAVEKYYYDEAQDSKTGYTMRGKKIIIAPYEYEAGHYLYGTDSLVIGSAYDIEEYYLYYIETGEWYKQVGTDMDGWLQQQMEEFTTEAE